MPNPFGLAIRKTSNHVSHSDALRHQRQASLCSFSQFSLVSPEQIAGILNVALFDIVKGDAMARF
jgi:hypothetical protein